MRKNCFPLLLQVLSMIWLLIFCPPLFGAPSLELQGSGKTLQVLSLETLKKKLRVHEIELVEPHVNLKKQYLAFSMTELLQQFYGKNWDVLEEMVFTCVDGYQPSLPIDKFRGQSAFLAFAEKNQDRFEVFVSDKKKMVSLEPFYLVWVNQEPLLSWPYQVVKIDIKSFRDVFAAMIPPSKVFTKVKDGFLAFRDQCFTCHRINGVGGKLGRDLNFPVNITEYWLEEWLIKWIDHPQSMVPESTMPRLSFDLKERQKVIVSIVEYLKVMKNHKIDPKS